MRALTSALLLAVLMIAGCSSKNTFVAPTNTIAAPKASDIIDNTPKIPAVTAPK